jgi:hypothetical protein
MIRQTITIHVSGTENIRAYRKEIERLLKLDGRKFTINVETRTGFNRSTVPKVSFRETADILAEAHQDIYTANPQGRPFRHRTAIARPMIRDLVKRKFLEAEKRAKPVTRAEYIRAINRDMKIFREPLKDVMTDSVASALANNGN